LVFVCVVVCVVVFVCVVVCVAVFACVPCHAILFNRFNVTQYIFAYSRCRS
jgi:hypothetical protein